MIYIENASSNTVKDCALKAAGAEKTTIPFFAPFLYYKYTMNVPRQARDRRRKSSGKNVCLRRHRGDMDGRGKSEPHYLGQLTERC
jgi:hypothetical protein